MIEMVHWDVFKVAKVFGAFRGGGAERQMSDGHPGEFLDDP